MKTLTPLTDAQRAAAEQWMPQAAKLAIERSGARQAADVDDAVQDAFLQTCKSVQTFRDDKGAKLRTHLWWCVKLHMLTEYHRREARGFSGLSGKKGSDRPPVPFVAGGDSLKEGLREVATGPTAEDEAELTDLQRAVREAIRRLPDRQASAVYLRCLCGWKLAEIGWYLGVTKEAVRQIVAKGMEGLKAELADIAEWV